MSAIHAFLGLATAVLAAALLALTTASALLGPRLPSSFRAWLVDGFALVVEAAVVVTALGGALLLATGHGPADLLHLLYAAIAAIALPSGLAVAMNRKATGPRRDRWLALTSLFLVGIAIRLIQTG